MTITADTNVLVRAAVMDDLEQTELAVRTLFAPEAVAVTLPSLCEFVWVLRSAYGRKPAEVADSIRKLIGNANVVVERSAVEAGLAVLDKGGDFADGVIAFEGRRVGGRVFTSFDQNAVDLIALTGGETRLLSTK